MLPLSDAARSLSQVTDIGPHTLRNNVLLAPMAGVTDVPFRALAWRFGVGYVASEMLAAGPQLWNSEKSRQRRVAVEGVRPRCVQIAGGDPKMVADAARRHWQDGADIVDINFGCPAKKVCRKAAGSQLMKDESLIAAIVEATVSAVPIPVTVKMRTGWSPERRNGLAVARIVQEQGAAAVTVHGRTRACRFEGEAEYDTVAEIKSNLQVPVFANGDIDSREKAHRVMQHTAVDGIMIGRAALGAPWLPGLIAHPGRSEPTLLEKWSIAQEHVRALHEFYGVPGVRIARKHVQWYLARMYPGDVGRALARAFNRFEEAEQQLAFLACAGEGLAA